MSSLFTVYRSSAGSGKTHTLVKEYIKLAISGSDYAKRFARILAITFTNKAAEEMKERVMQNLFVLRSNSNHSSYNPNYLNEISEFTGLSAEEVQKRAGIVFTAMLHNYHLLKITTIDKFTVSLVYSFARDLDIDADHEIVTDADEVINEGVSQLVEQSGKDPALTKMFVDFLGFELEDGNKFNAQRELKRFCEKVLDEKGYEALAIAGQYEESAFLEAGRVAAAKLTLIDQQIETITNHALKQLQMAGISRECFYFKGSGNFSWLEKVNKEGFSAIEEGARVREFIEDENKRWQKKLESGVLQKCMELEPLLVDTFLKILELKKHERKNYIVHKTVRQNAFSMALFKRLHQAIIDYKTQNSVILLSEFTKMVSDIVAAEPAPFIYERLGERVKNIFVDEFQDTSSLQFSNLVPLMENSLSTNNFVMLVGDAKQSIYRWRSGNVDQFIQLPLLPDYTTKDHPYRQGVFKEQFEEKKLPVNYRSLDQIIEFNNSFFEQLVQQPQLQSEQLSLAYKDIRQEASPHKKGGYVEAMVMNTHQVNPSEIEQQQKDYTIQCIHKCIEQGYLYSDITVLVRTHREGEVIFTSLMEQGIPVVSNQALALPQAFEIKLLVEFFAAFTFPGSGTSLKKFVVTWFSKHDVESSSEKLIASIPEHSNMEYFKLIIQSMGIHFDMQEAIKLNLYEQFLYVLHCLRLPQQNAFVSAFLELVFGFYRKHGTNSNGFIEWWQNKSTSFKLQTSQNSESVKIVTIHKSKGLQYPVVILPFVHTNVKMSDRYFWLYDVPGYSIKPLPVQYGKQLGDTEWNKQYDEEMDKAAFDFVNLLYVAFTRAEEQLFLLLETSAGHTNDPVLEALKSLKPDHTSSDFSFGKPVEKSHFKTHTKDTAPTHPMAEMVFKPWFDKLQVSTHSLYNTTPSYNPREAGILLHEIMAKIGNRPGSMEKVLFEYVRNGKLATEEAIDIKKQLSVYYSSERVSKLLQQGAMQLTEALMTDGNGKIKRPDQVFVLPNGKAMVIDIKTGEMENDHKQQVVEYADLLNRGGYPIDSGWLYYVKSNTWINVGYSD